MRIELSKHKEVAIYVHGDGTFSITTAAHNGKDYVGIQEVIIDAETMRTIVRRHDKYLQEERARAHARTPGAI